MIVDEGSENGEVDRLGAEAVHAAVFALLRHAHTHATQRTHFFVLLFLFLFFFWFEGF